MRPITAARWSSRFSFRRSRSMRAAISAWSVSGIRFDERRRPRAASAIVSSTKSGLPSVFSSSVFRSDGGSSRSASSASSELLALLGRERLELDRGGAEAAAAPARADVEQLRAGEAEDQQRRVLDAARRGARSARAAAPRPSGRPRRRARAAARRRARRPTRAPPRRSPAGCARPRSASSTPTASASRSATASSPHWARSFAIASWTGSSSAIPAATLTISASGQ